MNNIDLQIQTTASDGKHTPREILDMAREFNMQVIAITDHDTVGGVKEALRAGKEYGIRVVPGIEMSAEERGTHILGYGIDHHNKNLLRKLRIFAEQRIEGAKQMVENLKKEGFVLEWEDVLREAQGVVARPHLARAVLSRPENKEKLGNVSSVHDFIEKYLTDENKNYVRRARISVADAIKLIKNSGGVAVWSHPAIHFKDKYDELEEFLKKMMGWGIAGMEVFNPSHTEDDVEFLYGLTAEYNLIRTAGSDFHVAGKHPRDPESGLHSAETLGDFETHGFPIDDIMEKLDAAMLKQKSTEK